MSFLTTKGKAPAREPVQEKEKMREKAIAFGNHIAELEERLEDLDRRFNDMERRAKMAEAQVAQLSDDKMELRRERDDFQARYLQTQTKLKTAGNIILDAIKDEPAERYRPKPASLRAVEKALATKQAMETDDQAPPIPQFLERPRDDQDEK